MIYQIRPMGRPSTINQQVILANTKNNNGYQTAFSNKYFEIKARRNLLLLLCHEMMSRFIGTVFCLIIEHF